MEARNRILEIIKTSAKKITDEHVRVLNENRQTTRKFKVLDSSTGKPIGRALNENGKAFNKHVANGRTMIEAIPVNSDKKYYVSLNSILYPCQQECKKKYCPRCKFKGDGYSFEEMPFETALIFMITLCKRDFKLFKYENNFCPTLTLLKCFSKNEQFMELLENKNTSNIIYVPLLIPTFCTNYLYQNAIDVFGSVQNSILPDNSTLSLPYEPESNTVEYQHLDPTNSTTIHHSLYQFFENQIVPFLTIFNVNHHHLVENSNQTGIVPYDPPLVPVYKPEYNTVQRFVQKIFQDMGQFLLPYNLYQVLFSIVLLTSIYKISRNMIVRR